MTMKKGVVVFLDSLGTKNRDEEETENFCKNKEAFLKEVNGLWDIRKKRFNKDFGLESYLPEPEIAAFQDSIILCWSDQDVPKDFLPVYLSAGQWLIDAIPLAIIHYDLFFRGAISIGNYVFKNSQNNVTVLGPAVYDAVNCERYADWIGVIMTRQCKDEYELFLKSDAVQRKEKVNPQYYEVLFVKYPVPLHKEKPKELYVSSWPFMACRIEQYISISQILLEKSRNVDPKYQPKYDNTKIFLEWYKKMIFPQIPKH